MMSEESKELLQVGIELMKRLEREETVLPTSRYTNQWRNEVGDLVKAGSGWGPGAGFHR